MRYEKKMLILSGEGKGVVLIEKSGLGVKFALRTFGVKRGGMQKKAGIVTPAAVFVRDLPDVDDPSLVFYLDGADTENIHFAVFDRELILYGTNGKRMWEANLMGLLSAHDRSGGVALPVAPAAPRLAPLSEKPTVLPLPDGTGMPQSRDEIYGDDAIASSDFYTTLNLSERMKVVDGFLDTSRVVGNRPAVSYTHLENPSLVVSGSEKRNADTVDKIAADLRHAADAETEKPEAAVTVESDRADEQAHEIAEDEAEVKDLSSIINVETPDTVENAEPPAQTLGNSPVQEQAVIQNVEHDQEQIIEREVEREVASTVDKPWQYAARFLCKLSKREPIIEKSRVEPIKPREKVPYIRETQFFERVHGDIDKLFSAAERDDELCALLPDVEFVRVEFDGHVVSVGKTREFLCYAVAGLYERTSPLGEEAQWLPRVRSAPTGRGYWLVFQDINSGRILQS